jgi:hypothetical protein
MPSDGDLIVCDRCGERELYEKMVPCMHCATWTCMYCWQHEGVMYENDDYICGKCCLARYNCLKVFDS